MQVSSSFISTLKSSVLSDSLKIYENRSNNLTTIILFTKSLIAIGFLGLYANYSINRNLLKI